MRNRALHSDLSIQSRKNAKTNLPRGGPCYITLGEFLWLAEQVSEIAADVLTKAFRSDLADSAPHAPQAGLGGEDFYPDIHDKAAVLVCRLAWNHPLPDGNKRAPWASLVMFIDLNNETWKPDPPDVDEAEEAMLETAAGNVD